MGKNTKIEWTAIYLPDGTIIPGHTFNPWIGCTRVSDGCKHCYAETLMDHRFGKVEWGPQGERQRTSESYWAKPYKWNQQARAEGRRYRVFCGSLCDVFEDRSELENWRYELLQLIINTPRLDWLLLTKRPENVDRLIEQAAGVSTELWLYAAQNTWIGTSIEDQASADERIPHLLRIPARVLFLSCEPLLGTIDLLRIKWPNMEHWVDVLRGGFWHETGFINHSDLYTIDWVICGGESGPQARPMHPDWARSLRAQCQEAGVPFFFKQWGRWWPTPYNTPTANTSAEFHHGQWFVPCGKKAAGRELDGLIWEEFPETRNMVGS